MNQVDMFRRVVDSTPDDILSMSRMHCHCEGVGSIVCQKKEDGRLIRAFIVGPLAAGLAKNSAFDSSADDNRALVGIHNHRYNLAITLVCGLVHNDTYCVERGPVGPLKHDDELCLQRLQNSKAIRRYIYKSGVATGQPPVIQEAGVVYLTYCNDHTLEVAEPVSMDFQTLHTIRAEVGAIWWVEELTPPLVDYTFLYTNAPQLNCGSDDLYWPMTSADAVRTLVADFCENHADV